MSKIWVVSFELPLEVRISFKTIILECSSFPKKSIRLKIGLVLLCNFENEIYHAEIIENNVWFALTDKEDYNEIKVIDLNGNELATYSVGKFPGDFAIWNQDNN